MSGYIQSSHGSPIWDEYTKLDANRKHHYIPTVEEMEIAQYVKSQVGVSRRVRQPDLKQIVLRMAYYLGDQWPEADGFFERLIDIQIADDDRIVYNYVRAACNSMVSRLTENRPTITVIPATLDEDDKERARASEKLLEHLWFALGMGLKVREFAQFMVISGLGALKVYWDPEGGQDYEVDLSEEEAALAAFEGHPPTKTIRSGGIKVDVVAPEDWGYDPGAKEINNAHWAYHEQVLHLDYIRTMWPENGQYVQPNTQLGDDRYSQSAMRRIKGDQEEGPLDRARVVEYFEMPSPRHPRGRYAVVSDDVVLKASEELPFGELPFVTARHNAVPGKLQGDGAIDDLFDPQRQVNEKNAQRKATTDRMANPPWIAPKGVLDRPPEGIPGEIIEYNHTKGPPPRQAQVPPMPREHADIASEAINHIFEIAGITDLARGRIPSGLSGRSIGMATDLEASLLGPTVREMQAALEEVGARFLKYWNRYMPVPISLKVMGRGKLSEVIEFHAQDITSFDVRILSDSMLPRHPSYRREQLLMFIERGMFGDVVNDPAARRKALKLLEWGDLEEIEGDNDDERHYAREEQALFERSVQDWQSAGAAQGEYMERFFPLSVRADEDHETHGDEHDTYSKTGDFRRLPQEAQLAFMAHKGRHAFAASKQAMGQPWFVQFLSPEEQQEFQMLQQAQQAPQAGPGMQPPPPQPIDAFGPNPGLPSEQAAAPGAPDLQQLAAMLQSQQNPAEVASPLFMGQQMGGAAGPGLPGSGLEGAL